MSGCWEAVISREKGRWDIFSYSCISHPLLYLAAPVSAVIHSSYQWCSPNSPLSYTSAPELAPAGFHHANWSCVTKRRIWPSSWLDQILTSHCCQLNRGEKQRKKTLKYHCYQYCFSIVEWCQQKLLRYFSCLFEVNKAIVGFYGIREGTLLSVSIFSDATPFIFLHCCCSLTQWLRDPQVSYLLLN